MRTLLLLSVLVACGSSSAPVPVAVAPTVVATPRRGADDVEVARVNGRAVWASCVTAQAAGLVTSARTVEALRAAALDQCVAFELLAQAAEARGLAAAPEVRDATRRAAVNRLVETDFEQRYRSPADLREAIDAVMQKNEWRLHVPELRASSYARFVVPDHAPPEVDAAAHALADQLAAELAGQTGLYNVHLKEAANRIAAGSTVKLDLTDVEPSHRDRLVDSYAAALYAIPEVGQSSAAFRTPWGWDVIVWTGGITAKERARDEVVAEMFPELRRRQFRLWVTQLGKQLGVRVEVEQAALEQLDSDEPVETPAPSATPAPPRTP
jgi:hypothetical protein